LAHCHSLQGHRDILQKVISTAKHEALIVSPFLTTRALKADNIPELIRQAVSRGVRIKIVADVGLNSNVMEFKRCVSILKSAGAHVFLAEQKGIHSKVLSRDSNLVVSGSFNWLAAVRQKSAYQRFEVSFVQEGAAAAAAIHHLEEEIREVLGKPKKAGASSSGARVGGVGGRG
jgi:phosphatidylserine/phosphatidylglycerophosphate/cardiolipin synthase-like enzyme